MSFKVGDRIIIKGNVSHVARRFSGEQAIITGVHHDEGYYDVNLTTGGIWFNEAVAFNKVFNNESDYLDAFQFNFKDGV